MAIKISGTTVVDDSRNICNIANVTASGTISLNSIVYPTGDGTAGQVLKTDGSGTLSFGTDSGEIECCTYTASTTWTKPTGAKTVFVELMGGGGGGGGGACSASGGGGGGGGYNRHLFPAPSLANTVCVVVGAGGSGASPHPGYTGAIGTDGGNSCFSTLVVYGGKGGGGAPAGGPHGRGGNGGDAATAFYPGKSDYSGSHCDCACGGPRVFGGGRGRGCNDGARSEFGGGGGGVLGSPAFGCPSVNNGTYGQGGNGSPTSAPGTAGCDGFVRITVWK